MIHFERFTLKNGLRVIFHRDKTTPLAVVNTLYDVGARDESADKTGFAHLFEHLMFGGSINIPDYDAPLQLAGGESNAFTSNDITNYYNSLPAKNIETALWLESDRMLSLAFTENSLEVQRNVVIEEFKQRYLNQPYGDVWLEFRPLAYTQHPYQWATIGKEIKHIEDATMADVKSFFKKHYHPSNAILCIAGNFEFDEIQGLVEKWYGEIPTQKKYSRKIEMEPIQFEYRTRIIERAVPSDAFYYGFKMPGRIHDDYLVADLLSDILGRSHSSRLYVRLKKELDLVLEINAYVMGSHDSGLLMISGKANKGVDLNKIDDEIWALLDELKSNVIASVELQKYINKIRTTKVFSEQGILNKAMGLSLYELLGDANEMNNEGKKYDQITTQDVYEQANQIFRKENCSRMYVKSSHHA